MNATAANDSPSRIHSWLAARTPWQRRCLALVAGAVATLGHAPFQLTLAYVIAIVALVWLLDGAATHAKKRWSGFVCGWFFGLGHFSSGLYWVASAFNVDSDAWGPVWGVPATLGLAGGLALFWGIGGALAVTLWTRDVRRIAAFALAFFAIEWLRGNVFTGLPWLLPGYVWTPGEPISQLASLVGIYGLTLLTLLVAAAPAAIADRQASAGARFVPLVIAGLVVGLGWGWGAQRLSRTAVDLPGELPIVRVTDSGMSQAEKWESRPDQEWRVLARYLAASGGAEDSRAEIVIWPEGAIPTLNFFVLENQDFLNAIGRGMGDRVLMGITRRELQSDQIAYFNSAAVIDGVTGVPRIGQISDKNHLVPFGEYMPGFIRLLNIPSLQRVGDFQAGPPPTRLIIPDAPPAVVLICYEAIFPGMIPHGDERPGWIIMVTNDAWFGGGSGPYQHYAMARYRAIEEGLPVARAASGGVSAIIDSYGRAVRATYRRDGYAEAQLPPALVETPWAKWGSILLVFLLAIVVALRLFPVRVGGEGQKR